MSRRPLITIALATAVMLVAPAAAHSALPKIGNYCGGKKDAAGICEVTIGVYKFKGKTLVSASTRIATKDFVCQPSGTKGFRGIPLNRVFLNGMPLKGNGSFKGTEKPPIGKPTLTVSGKFPTATKVDVTFFKSFLPVGPPGENCTATKRFVVNLKKQKTVKTF